MVRKLLLNRSKNRQVQLKLVGFIFTENSNTVQKTPRPKALTKTSALGRFRLFKMQWVFGFAFNRSGLFYL